MAAYRNYLDYLEFRDFLTPEQNYKLKKHYQLPKRLGKTRKGIAVDRKKWAELIKLGKHEQARLAIYIGLKAGLRSSEIRHLRVEDIDFEHKEIKIRERKEDKSKGQLDWYPKHFKEREVPFDDDMFHTLKNWVENIRPTNLGHPYLIWNPDPRAKPGIISDRAFWGWIKKAGVNGHDLRRSCLTDALYRTKNPRVAQLVAGHSSLSTTTNYITSDKEKAFDQFRNMS
jgi:integrase